MAWREAAYEKKKNLPDHFGPITHLENENLTWAVGFSLYESHFAEKGVVLRLRGQQAEFMELPEVPLPLWGFWDLAVVPQ